MIFLSKPIAKLLMFGLIFLSPSISAKNTANDQATSSEEFAFVNHLNSSLSFKLDKIGFHGVKTIAAFKKNNHIIVQVIHNPLTGYKELIDEIAASGSRVNGVSFQNSLTLHILDRYCSSGAFYEIQAAGLSRNVFVQYDNTKGQRVAVHTISKEMCSSTI